MKSNILASWNDTLLKESIIDFVEKVSNESGMDFIPVSERIATFDNDGTLWTEQPLQVELFFALDRATELAKLNPDLKSSKLFNAFIEMDVKTIMTFPKKDILELLFKTHDGKTPEEFQSKVRQWFDTASHPRFKFSYYKAAFKPQLELLDYLRQNGFKTFIVSGGGVDFMRAVAEKIYGIPSYMTVGSSGITKIEYEGNAPGVIRLPQLRNFDDKDEKVNNIHFHIGKRPVLAFGNSDGDLAMLRYALAGKGPRMALILHHDDNEREVAYDKDFKISPLNEALNVAAAEGINVVSMKNDWNKVFEK